MSAFIMCFGRSQAQGKAEHPGAWAPALTPTPGPPGLQSSWTGGWVGVGRVGDATGRQVGAWVRSLSYPCRVLICMLGGHKPHITVCAKCWTQMSLVTETIKSPLVLRSSAVVVLPKRGARHVVSVAECLDYAYGYSQWPVAPRPLVGDNSPLSPQQAPILTTSNHGLRPCTWAVTKAKPHPEAWGA